jgi:hypothetical protein
MEIRDSRIWAQAQGPRDVCGLPIHITSEGRLVYAVTPIR